MTKVCTGCATEKALEDFPLAKTYRGGRNTRCRSCRAAAARLQRRTNEVRRLADQAVSRRWKAAHREELLERDRGRVRNGSPAARRASAKRYNQRHPESNRVRCATRYARTRGVLADLTHAQWLEILDAHDHRCAYCGVDGPLQQEHVVPVSRGGAHTASNVVPACPPCNYRKYNRTGDEFLALTAADVA